MEIRFDLTEKTVDLLKQMAEQDVEWLENGEGSPGEVVRCLIEQACIRKERHGSLRLYEWHDLEELLEPDE